MPYLCYFNDKTKKVSKQARFTYGSLLGHVMAPRIEKLGTRGVKLH